MTHNGKIKGYIFGAVAAASYGMNPLFALPLYKDGMNVDSVLFFRYLLAIPILCLMIRWRGRNCKIQRQSILPLIIMGLLMACSSLTLFMSYNYMPAGLASTLLFVYPIMVAVIMGLFFKEKISWVTAICLIIALCGIGLLYKGDGKTTLSLIGILLVMLSSLSYAIYLVGVNRQHLRTVPTVQLTFYVLVFGLSLFVVRIIIGHSLILPAHWYNWLNLFSLALLPTVISLLCTTKAIQHIGSTQTAVLGALEPLTAVVIGVLVFHEVLTFRLICGIILIIAAVTFIILGDHLSEYMIRFRKLFPKIPRHTKKTNPNEIEQDETAHS